MPPPRPRPGAGRRRPGRRGKLKGQEETTSKAQAIPMVQARRLAAETGERERAREALRFEPTATLRRIAADAGADARRECLRKTWRWAVRKVVADRLRLDVVLARAAADARLAARPRALAELARRRRGRFLDAATPAGGPRPRRRRRPRRTLFPYDARRRIRGRCRQIQPKQCSRGRGATR